MSLLGVLGWIVYGVGQTYNSAYHNQARKEARSAAGRRGDITYWYNGEMYLTKTNTRCYTMVNNENETIVYNRATGEPICNATKIARERQFKIADLQERNREEKAEWDALSENVKTKILKEKEEGKKKRRKKNHEKAIITEKGNMQAILLMWVLFDIIFEYIFFTFGAINIIVLYLIGSLFFKIIYYKNKRKEINQMIERLRRNYDE